MVFCKNFVTAIVGGIDSCKYIIKNKKVTKSVIKTGYEVVSRKSQKI